MSEHRRGPVPPGWNETGPAHLPTATAAPALFAFGLTLAGWGLIASPLLIVIGGAVFFAALFHWMRELGHAEE